MAQNPMVAMMAELKTVVKEAVNLAMEQNPMVQSSPKKNKNTGRGGQSSLNVGDIVAQVLSAVQPTLVALVNSGIASATQTMWNNLSKKEEDDKMNNQRLEREVSALKARQERHEQYTRRETVKIMNLPVSYTNEEGQEDTDKAVIELAKKVGVVLKPEDISVSHRVPRRGAGVAPLVCKFARRNA